MDVDDPNVFPSCRLPSCIDGKEVIIMREQHTSKSGRMFKQGFINELSGAHLLGTNDIHISPAQAEEHGAINMMIEI